MQAGPLVDARIALLRELHALDCADAAARVDNDGGLGAQETYLNLRGELLARLAAVTDPWSEEERALLQTVVELGADTWQRMAAQKAQLAQRLQSLQQRRRELAPVPANWTMRVRRTC